MSDFFADIAQAQDEQARPDELERGRAAFLEQLERPTGRRWPQAAAVLAVLSIPTFAQAVKRAAFDVTNYVMDVSLMPTERRINATVAVSFTPLEDTRSVSFELNGSLKVDSITRLDKMAALPVTPPTKTSSKALPVKITAPQSAVTFVQDQTNSTDLGPHVRIDLGEMFFEPEDVQLEAGKPYVIELVNIGEVKHEFAASKFFRSVATRKVENSEYPVPKLSRAICTPARRNIASSWMPASNAAVSVTSRQSCLGASECDWIVSRMLPARAGSASVVAEKLQAT